jgi:triosephosphate isomerase
MLIVANWKAYVETPEKAKALFAAAKKVSKIRGMEIVLAPAAPQLGLLAPGNKSKVAFAAQNLSETTGGAKTGEVTAPMFAALGATYAIVGHSERRAMGETNAIAATKVAHAIAHDLIPILCVGEAERDDAGKYLQFVRAEITEALADIDPKDRGRVVVAYEPIWAIGKSAEDAIHAHDLAEMALYIRKVLAELLPGKTGKTRVLYGGSVEPANIRDLAGGSMVDGFLVGHASADPLVFTALVKALA